MNFSRRIIAREKDSSALYFFHLETSSSHLPSYLGIAFLNSGCQWSIPKIDHYTCIFQKQGWVWSAKSSIQQIHVLLECRTAKNTLGGLSFMPLIFL